MGWNTGKYQRCTVYTGHDMRIKSLWFWRWFIDTNYPIVSVNYWWDRGYYQLREGNVKILQFHGRLPRIIFNRFTRLPAQANFYKDQTDLLSIGDNLHDLKFDSFAGNFLVLVELSSVCQLRVLVWHRISFHWRKHVHDWCFGHLLPVPSREFDPLVRQERHLAPSLSPQANKIMHGMACDLCHFDLQCLYFT